MVDELVRQPLKRVLVFCPNRECPLLQFLEQHPAGMDYIFETHVPTKLTDMIHVRDPDLVLILVSNGFADWPLVVDKIGEVSHVPVVVAVPTRKDTSPFLNRADLVATIPLTFDDRIRFITSIFNLSHGVSPTGEKHSARSNRSAAKEFLRLLQWILMIAILLSTLAAMTVLLAKNDVQTAAVTFGTIFSSTIAAFTSVGAVRLIQYYMRLRKGGPREQ